MRFQPVKCNIMQLTRKHSNKIQTFYTLEGTVLENVDNIKYLGVTITNDLKWNTHISNICTKANRTLGFLRRTPFSCPQDVKEAAYKGMVRPILEYGSSVSDPYTDKLQEELEKDQNCAARFVTRNYVYGKLQEELENVHNRAARQKCATEISTPWPFRYPLLVKMSISIASSPRLSVTGMTSLNL